MDTEQVENLSSRLREIGFSDRAVSMIVEQVQEVGFSEPIQNDGLAETGATYEAVVARTASQADPRQASDLRSLTLIGALLALVSLILGWSAMTGNQPGEIAIMAGAGSGASWFQGIQALFLTLWVAVPPLLSVWQGNANSKLRQLPLLVVWGAVGLALATLLLASAA